MRKFRKKFNPVRNIKKKKTKKEDKLKKCTVFIQRNYRMIR